MPIELTPDSAGMEIHDRVDAAAKGSALTPDSAGMETRAGDPELAVPVFALTPDSAGMETIARADTGRRSASK